MSFNFNKNKEKPVFNIDKPIERDLYIRLLHAEMTGKNDDSCYFVRLILIITFASFLAAFLYLPLASIGVGGVFLLSLLSNNDIRIRSSDLETRQIRNNIINLSDYIDEKTINHINCIEKQNRDFAFFELHGIWQYLETKKEKSNQPEHINNKEISEEGKNIINLILGNKND